MAATWTDTPDVPAELTSSKARKAISGSDLEGATTQGTGDERLSPLSGDAPPDDFDVHVSNAPPPPDILVFVAPDRL